jgi:hypothetical protein
MANCKGAAFHLKAVFLTRLRKITTRTHIIQHLGYVSKLCPLKYETRVMCINFCVVSETMVEQRTFYLWILYGIATGNLLDSRGSISVNRNFSTSSRQTLESVQPSTQQVLGPLSAGAKRPRREANHLSLFSDEIKNGGAITPLLHTSSWHDA